jgi:hypothetical protein
LDPATNKTGFAEGRAMAELICFTAPGNMFDQCLTIH